MALVSKDSWQEGEDPPRPEKNRVEFVAFQGRQVTQVEYAEICRNLAEYFGILRAWLEKERSGEEE
ncbi:MAG: hypothetical protein ABII79_06280 [bacterium]